MFFIQIIIFIKYNLINLEVFISNSKIMIIFQKFQIIS